MIEFKQIYAFMTEMSAKREGATLSNDDQGKLYELSLAKAINNHPDVGRGDRLPRHHRSYSDNPDHAGTPGQVYDRLMKKAGENSSEVSQIKKQAEETASMVVDSLKESGHLGRTETNGVKHPQTRITNVFWTSNPDKEKKEGDHELTTGIRDPKSKGDVMVTVAPRHPVGYHKENDKHYKSGHDQGVIALVEQRRAEARGEKYTPPKNPHPSGSKAHKVWNEGFGHGQMATHVNISAKYASKPITFENPGIKSIEKKTGSAGLAEKLKAESDAHDRRMAAKFGYSGSTHKEIHAKKFKPDRTVYEKELNDHKKKNGGSKIGFKPKSKQAKKVHAAYAAANDSYKTSIGYVRKAMQNMKHSQLRSLITDTATPDTVHHTIIAHSDPKTGKNSVHSEQTISNYVDQYKNLRVESKEDETGPVLHIVGDHPKHGKGITVAQLGYRIGHGITGSRQFDFKMPGFGKKRQKKEALKEMILEARERNVMSKAEKAAAALQRMQAPIIAANRSKQIKQSKETSDASSDNESNRRRILDTNRSNAALNRQSKQAKTQTFWRDEEGIPHVGGGEFVSAMAKAINLSDKSTDLGGVPQQKRGSDSKQKQMIDDPEQAILSGAGAAALNYLEKNQKYNSVDEEAPANAMGTAGISGASTAVDSGVTGYDVPIGMVRRKPPKIFAGKAVFTVPSSDFYNATLGRKKGKHYRSYVSGELGEEVRQYALQNKNAPIILEDETTGAMMYLKYGKK